MIRSAILSVLAAAVLALAAAPTVMAQDVWSNRDGAVLVPHKPSLRPSLAEIRQVFLANAASYAIWCRDRGLRNRPGSSTSCFEEVAQGRIATLNLSVVHIDLIGADPAQLPLSMDTADIGQVEIYHVPRLNPPFSYAVKITPRPGAQDQSVFWLRVGNADVARQLADAFTTLAAAGSGAHTLEVRPPAFGVLARELTAEEMAQAAVEGGVFVGGVDAGSPAERLGLAAGDLLLEINGVKIADLDAARQALGAGTVQSVRVWRDGRALHLGALIRM